MKTKKLEKWLLLEQSGELSSRQLHQLTRELAGSEEARKLREELGRLKGLVLQPDADPSPWAVARISARLREFNRPDAGFYKVWKPALAMAAGLTVLVSFLNFHEGQTSSAPAAVIAAAEVGVWDVPFEEDLSRLENLIVAISGDPADIMDM